MAKKPTKKKLLELAETYAGCVQDIATACNVARQTVSKWKNEDPDFKSACENGNDVLVDLALKGLRDLLSKGSERSVHYTLDRLARDKGFGMLLQIKDKSKLDEQLDEMTDEQILEALAESRSRIEKAVK
jgi:hypothetical protein